MTVVVKLMRAFRERLMKLCFGCRSEPMDLNPYLDLLEPFYDPMGAWKWLHTEQFLLAGAVPCDLIRDGQGQRVLDLIQQLRDGVNV